MTSEESKAEKPNRQIFDMAMEKTKCSDPATAYHVGTSIDFDVSNFNSLNVFLYVSLPLSSLSFLLLLSVTHMDVFTDLFQSRYNTLSFCPQPILNHHLNHYLDRYLLHYHTIYDTIFYISTVFVYIICSYLFLCCSSIDPT
jgi:hypothetical protein